MSFSVPTLPKLGAVPSFHHELVIKATNSGIVYLKDGRFKKRYTGSNAAQVDINGKFYPTKKEYQKQLERDTPPDKRRKIKSPRKNQPDLKRGDISIVGGEDTKEIGTKKRKRGAFTINKVEVRNRLLMYIRTQKGKKELYFWTITFPAAINDQLAYQAFNTWLTALRQKKMLRDYIWVAERQDGKRLDDPLKNPTNNIHFHIAIPHKMSVVAANRMMQITLATFCKKGLMNYSVYQCKRYNGVELAKNKKTKRVTNFAIKKGTRSLINYLTKYVSKNNESFDHLAWHNSRGYSALFTGVTFTIAEFEGLLFKEYLLPKSIINTQFFMFFPWKTGPPDLLINHLVQLNDYVQSLSAN